MEDAVRLTEEHLTQEQQKTIYKTFGIVDTNHDRKINEAELRKALALMNLNLPEEDVQELLRTDKKGTGQIEYKDYESIVGKYYVVKNYRNKELHELFHKFDKNGDGFIEPKEIRKMLEEMGSEGNDELVKALVEEADTNHDGVISYEEFVAAVCEKDN